MKTRNHYVECICVLQELKKQHPSYTIGQHMYTALADYGNYWGMTDKEMLTALNKYKGELELSKGEDFDIDKVIRDGNSLFDIKDEEEEDAY